MRIRMLETRRGSEDSFTVRRFHEDETYDVGESLARSFIAKGWAYPVESSLFDAVTQIVQAFDASKP